jgi:integrase
MLRDRPRNFCLFTLGIHTAFRANELLSIRLAHVRHVQVGDVLDLKQTTTRTHRLVTLNRPSIEAIQYALRNDRHLRRADDDAYLFSSRFGDVLTVPTVTNLVKGWCQAVGLRGNYGSHTMRKTWGWWQYRRGRPVPLLMEAYGHATQKQTLDYLCIQAAEVAELYDLAL